MELRQLRHFLAVVDCGSIGRAAEAAHVSQQGLSASMKALERSLGVTLFERGPNGVKPNAMGLKLADYARSMLGQERLARAELQGLASAELGTAVAGVGVFFAQHIMPDAVLRLARRRPRVTVKIVEGVSDTLTQQLLDGAIDFAVTTPSATYEPHPDVLLETIFEDREQPVVRQGHPLAGRGTVDLSELAKFPWLFSSRFEGDRLRVFETFSRARIAPPEHYVLTDSAPVILDLLRRGDYVHVTLSAFLNDAAGDAPYVPLRSPELELVRRGAIFMRRDGAPSPASNALLASFRESLEAFLTRPVALPSCGPVASTSTEAAR